MIIIISLCLVRYVPPNPDTSYFNDLIAFLKSLAANEDDFIIVGDFNLPDSCWTSLSGCSPLSNLLCDFVCDTNLAQLINSPTHVKGNTLDILLTNSEHIISHISVSKPYDSLPSDHYKIYFFIESNFSINKTHKPLFVFDYKMANYEGLCDFLLDVDFSYYLQSLSVDQVWSFLKATLSRGIYEPFYPKI